jgi:hypothetical protein
MSRAIGIEVALTDPEATELQLEVRLALLVEVLVHHPGRLTLSELSLQLCDEDFEDDAVEAACCDMVCFGVLRREAEFVLPEVDALCFRASIFDQFGRG